MTVELATKYSLRGQGKKAFDKLHLYIRLHLLKSIPIGNCGGAEKKTEGF